MLPVPRTRRDVWIHATVNRNCPLCAANDTSAISHRMQFQLDLTTVICQRCGFVFSNPMPSEETYQRFYAEAYADFYGQIAGTAEGHKREPANVRELLDQIETLCTLRDARLLEIGPGRGSLMIWAKKRGASVIGLEPSQAFFEDLKRVGLEVMNTTLETLSHDLNGAIDIIVMSHVLEHFFDPNRALARCYQLLGEEGILACVVPNILRPYRSLDRYFLRYVHPSSFSPSTLHAMLAKHGFSVALQTSQGSRWHSPQSILAVARKYAQVRQEVRVPSQSAGEVLSFLRRYRWRWRWFIGPRWHLRQWLIRVRRLLSRGLRLPKSTLR